MLREIKYILGNEEYSSKLCHITKTTLFHILSGEREEHLRNKAQYAIKQGDNITLQKLSYENIIALVKNPDITSIERTDFISS